MLRFAKPDGTPFDLDYMGDIHVFSSGNDRIAICVASRNGEEIPEDEVNPDTLADFDLGNKMCALPEEWSSWEILVEGLTEQMQTILQRAIASAWATITLVERIIVKE